MSEIKLPPLPKDELLSFGHTNEAMKEYARAAVRADRKKTSVAYGGEVFDSNGESLGYCTTTRARGLAYIDELEAKLSGFESDLTHSEQNNRRISARNADLMCQVAEALAHLRTLANFGGTLEQARELAQKGVERVEGMK